MIGGSKLLLALGSAIASLNVFEVQFEPTRYQQNLKKLGGAELNLNRASRTLFTSGYAMIHLVTLCNIRLHVIYALVAATGRYRSSVVVRNTTRLWRGRKLPAIGHILMNHCTFSQLPSFSPPGARGRGPVIYSRLVVPSHPCVKFTVCVGSTGELNVTDLFPLREHRASGLVSGGWVELSFPSHWFP